MEAPTIAGTLAGLPGTVTAIRASAVTGVRGFIYRLGGRPEGQCYGDTMVIADALWDGATDKDLWDFWEIVRHELVHHHQSRGWRLPFFALAYLLLPLPVGFSGRAILELAGYRETLRCRAIKYRSMLPSLSNGEVEEMVRNDAPYIARMFRRGRYGFMGWFFTEAWWVRRLLSK